jgi:hypothetical protein
MKLGIKVGPQRKSFDDLDATSPDMCEVWFNVNRSNEYIDLFSKLKSMKIDVGLHFWGVLLDNTMVNITYPDHELNDVSEHLILHAIEIAASNGFKYVNIHPGSRARINLNLSTYTYEVMNPPVEESVAIENFLKHVVKISEQAKRLGVLLTIETVPARVKNDLRLNPADHGKAINIYELGFNAIHQAASAGIAIANDFCHTAASFIDSDRMNIWRNLLQTTINLAEHTQLLHLGFLIPPYNGTDFHGDLDHSEFETSKAIPNSTEFITLLKLFVNRPDVWALVEPESDHVKNYFIARKFIKIAQNK